MTDREFEKWFNDNYPNPELLDDYTEDFMLGAWKARGELDAVLIKELEAEIKTWQEIANRHAKYEEEADVKIDDLTAKNKELEVNATRYQKLKSFMLPEVKVKTIWQGSFSDWTPQKDHVYVVYGTWEILEKSLDEGSIKELDK